MTDIILCDVSDLKKTVDEEKLCWISEVLDKLNVPEEFFEDADISDFRYNMETLGIEVELYSNGNVDIYKKQWHNGLTEEASDWLPATEEHLVAQWKEPKYIKRVEGKEVHYEIHLNEWSISNMR